MKDGPAGFGAREPTASRQRRRRQSREGKAEPKPEPPPSRPEPKAKKDPDSEPKARLKTDRSSKRAGENRGETGKRNQKGARVNSLSALSASPSRELAVLIKELKKNLKGG